MNISATHGVQFQGGMPSVEGSHRFENIMMNTGSDRHMQLSAAPADPEQFAGNFAGALNEALSNVEQLDKRSGQLTQQAVVDPDSVEAHTVVMAAERARFAMNLTKTVADGLVRAYRELTTQR